MTILLIVLGGMLLSGLAGLGLFCWVLWDLQRVSDRIERERE